MLNLMKKIIWELGKELTEDDYIELWLRVYQYDTDEVILEETNNDYEFLELVKNFRRMGVI
tara:strand:- start:165 stop:347 length:183 start_codon:yes stop_codon:yes gene_type:complete